MREAKAVLNGIQKNALETVDTYQKSVKKHLKGTSDDAVDTAYREANRECFGAQYALETYNKDVYEKASEANQNGVKYADYYDYYFTTKNYEATEEQSVATQKMKYLQSSSLPVKSKAEIYFADLANDSDLKTQERLERFNDITAVQYWKYKAATMGMTKKEEKLVAIDGLDLTKAQKTALYYANGWAKSTIRDAPWISGKSIAQS